MTGPYVPPLPGEAGARNGRGGRTRPSGGPIGAVYVCPPAETEGARPLAPLPVPPRPASATGRPEAEVAAVAGSGEGRARPRAGATPQPREAGAGGVADALRSLIRVIPDFPRPGDRFPDATPLLQAPRLLRRVVGVLATEAEARGAEAIGGIDPRGVLFGPLVALELALPFIPIGAPGTLAGQIRTAERRGAGAVPLRLAIHRGRLRPGDRVVLVDDLLVTGATAATAAGLVEELGGIVAGLLFLAEDPSAGGRRALGRYNVFSVLNLEEIISERT